MMTGQICTKKLLYKVKTEKIKITKDSESKKKKKNKIKVTNQGFKGNSNS